MHLLADAPARHVPAHRVGVVGLLVAATVVEQIAYPLTGGAARDRLTIATVLTFAAASITHATATRRLRGLSCCLVAGVVGLAAEILGVQTGVPFGHYSYAMSLGPRLGGVPLVVALAWTMMAWPSALAARALARSTAVRVLVASWAMASWDLFLDPQMVAAGRWQWATPSPHLPGVDTVPLTNFAGWLLVSGVISFAVQVILRGRADDRPMHALFLWTYASSVVAGLAFLHLPGAALWCAAGMGAVAVPLAIRVCR